MTRPLCIIFYRLEKKLFFLSWRAKTNVFSVVTRRPSVGERTTFVTKHELRQEFYFSGLPDAYASLIGAEGRDKQLSNQSEKFNFERWKPDTSRMEKNQKAFWKIPNSWLEKISWVSKSRGWISRQFSVSQIFTEFFEYLQQNFSNLMRHFRRTKRFKSL